MSNFSMSFILISCLLACPLRCATCGSDNAVREIEAATCPCCQHSIPSGESKQPVNDSDEDCPCPGCICDGATIGTSARATNSIVCLAAANDWGVVDVACSSENHPIKPGDGRDVGKSFARRALIALQLWQV